MEALTKTEVLGGREAGLLLGREVQELEKELSEATPPKKKSVIYSAANLSSLWNNSFFNFRFSTMASTTRSVLCTTDAASVLVERQLRVFSTNSSPAWADKKEKRVFTGPCRQERQALLSQERERPERPTDPDPTEVTATSLWRDKSILCF